jgi:3-hydroxyacyl-CoA dehydrogenase/3a,7a,12a-trihydroxy-5b-cholest-24-enoyl-CoA hydratase
MPIDLNQALGAKLPSMEYQLDPDKAILYALGVGCVPEGDELQYVYENGLKVLPTFGVIPPFPALMSLMTVPGFEINPVMVLHGEQYLEVRKHPIPVEGLLISKPKVAGIYDKGKGALIELDVETTDKDGTVIFFNRFGAFVRGESVPGADKGPAPGNEPPERAPDAVVEMKTLPQQAAIYRLSGDKNPLHIDPMFAQMAGYDRPIIHGLCTFGHVGRAILKTYCGNDPARFKSIKVRFSRPAWPGDTIVTEMWKVADTRIILRVRTAERPTEYCITNAAVELYA